MTPEYASPPTLAHRPVVVLGNGPSAKLVDFERLRGGAVASIGMNAAYRHWDRIDFRPTHYICMDTVVIQSHAPRIAELIREGRIERFFLRNEFLELHPEFAAHPRILWFDDVRGRAGSLFDTHWVTTGSWAIRWAAFEGCRLAILIGIDVNYVELLPGATRLGSGSDLRLELTRTPRFNPNYFFADYQQAGDRYNVPNDPAYKQQTGGLVHVDALREAARDMSRLGCTLKVVDGSPISSHGLFPKMELDRLLAGRRIALVTSFFGAAPADEVTNNVRIALSNAANPDIHRLRILFEGQRQELAAKVGGDLMRQLEQRERAGRIEIVRIERRPDYLFMFESARSLGQELCAVANADILLTPACTAGLLAEYFETDRPFLALTRWNRTANGLFIQGQVGHPPWQEVALEDLDAKQVNHLSFDLYCFDRRTPLPPGLQSVPIGTFGCDTAISALMRLGGQRVANPCLTHRIEHVDEKIRDYSSEKSKEQMLANSAVVREALLARFRALPAIHEALQALETLPPSLASVGTPQHSLGRWHSMKRMLGASPWRRSVDAPGIVFRKVELHTDDVRDRPEQVEQRLAPILDAGDFLELEVRGRNGPHYMECMYTQLRDRLFRYDSQSVLFVDMVSDDERRIHADVLMAVRQCLQLVSSSLDRTPGAASLVGAVGDQSGGQDRRAGGVVGQTAGAPARLLVIDPTPIGHMSATGQIKAQFLRGYPTDRILQVCELPGAEPGLALFRPGEAPDVRGNACAAPEAIDACVAFAPDVIYVRPVDSVNLLEFALALWARLPRPMVLHVMDDWLERARRAQRGRFHRLDFLMRQLLARSAVRLAISQPMAEAFTGRFDGVWKVLANGVDVQAQPRKDWSARPEVSETSPFVVRFLGGFAPDMGADSIVDVARVVGGLQADVAIRFEVFTMPWYLEAARSALQGIPGVRVDRVVDPSDYPRALAEADALLVAYNFDEISLAYCGLSMGNKMPECLASGVPVLAYGPQRSATIAALAASGCAEMVTERDESALRGALGRLARDLELCRRLGSAGRAWAAQHRSGDSVRKAFVDALREATGAPAVVLSPPRVYADGRSGIVVLAAEADAQGWSFRLRVSPTDAGSSVVCLLQTAGPRPPTVLPQVLGVALSEHPGKPITSAGADRSWIALRFAPPPEGGELTVTHRSPDAAWDVEAALLVTVPPPRSDLELSLARANRTWREEGPTAATACYVDLFLRDALSIYARNALLCAVAAARLSDDGSGTSVRLG